MDREGKEMKLSQVPKDSKVVFKTDIKRVPFIYLGMDGQYAKVRTYDARIMRTYADRQVEVIG